MVDVNLVFAAVRCEEPSHISEAHQVRELARRGSVRGQQSHYFLPSPHHSGLWESIHISQAREPQREVRRDDFGILWLGFQSRCLLEMRFLYYCGQKRGWLQVCVQFEGIWFTDGCKEAKWYLLVGKPIVTWLVPSRPASPWCQLLAPLAILGEKRERRKMGPVLLCYSARAGSSRVHVICGFSWGTIDMITDVFWAWKACWILWK